MVCKDFSAIPLLGAEVAMIFIHETHVLELRIEANL